MFDGRLDERAKQHLCGIAFGSRRSGGVAKNAARESADLLGRLQAPAPFLLFQFVEQFCWRDVSHRPSPELGA